MKIVKTGKTVSHIKLNCTGLGSLKTRHVSPDGIPHSKHNGGTTKKRQLQKQTGKLKKQK